MPKGAKFILSFILLFGFYFRFFNLMHDEPYFFNPDERNMAIAITQFRLPKKINEIPKCIHSEFFKKKSKTSSSKPQTSNCTLNPHFFAYSQFPLYLAYISDQFVKPVSKLFHKDLVAGSQQLDSDFSSAVYWLRFYSALTSALTIFIVYLISKELVTINYSLIAASLTAFTPGLIQAAHFGTTESILTFFFTLVIYLSLKLEKQINLNTLLLLSLAIGLAFGSKFTGIFFLFPPFLILLALLIKSSFDKRKKISVFLLGFIIPFKKLIKISSPVLLIILISFLIYRISSPYNFIEPESFRSAVFGYESDVATGKFAAFYTRQFFNSIPIVFQIKKIFPYALGLPIFILGTAGLLLVFLKIFIKNKKNRQNIAYLILFSSFIVYFIPNSFLYAKWSRFMTPILPFFAIFSGILIYNLKKVFPKKIFLILNSLFLILAMIPGIAFMSIYENPDSRVTSSVWIYENLPDKSYVLSETANVVDIPLGLPNELKPRNNNQLTVISFDFYHLNENPKLYDDLLNHLEKANYIFVPSRRIFKNHILQPEKFTLTNKYFELLFSGKLGFIKVAEFASYPSINFGPKSFQFPDEDAEETFTVFDHPVIRIYKKVKQLSQIEYNDLFQH